MSRGIGIYHREARVTSPETREFPVVCIHFVRVCSFNSEKIVNPSIELLTKRAKDEEFLTIVPKRACGTVGYVVYNTSNAARTLSAAANPSTAALTIPPAYPAPSPVGYKPSIETDCIVVLSRSMRTGDDVRASGA